MEIEIRLDQKATAEWWDRATFRTMVRKRFSGYGIAALVSVVGADGLVLDCWGRVQGRELPAVSGE